jgi:hypothetical protein
MHITFKQFLIETLDNPVPYSWIGKYDDQWTAKFQIDELIYHVIFSQDDENLSKWECVFTIVNQTNDQGMFALTGTGNAMTVFSTITKIAVDFIKNNSTVNMFVFTADGDSRKRFYDRWAKQLAHLFGGWDIRIIDRGVRKYILRRPM